MKIQEYNKTLIENFIESIWNRLEFNKLDSFLHSDFFDHSLPPSFQPNKDGLKAWIMTTGCSFKHNTIIDVQVNQGNKSVIKISMTLKHIGKWREIEPTGLEITTAGYRYFTISDGKIIGHWALIDGTSIENQLLASTNGCKIQ